MNIKYEVLPDKEKPKKQLVRDIAVGVSFVYSTSGKTITQKHEGVYTKVAEPNLCFRHEARELIDFGQGPNYFFEATLFASVAPEPL